jgi:hypothetical protein
MTTFFLRFPDEATAQIALNDAGIYIAPTEEESGYYKQADIGWAFDPIGTITRGGEWNPETGDELVAPTVLSGWHANYAGDILPDGLSIYLVTPQHPYRVFAGA